MDANSQPAGARPEAAKDPTIKWSQIFIWSAGCILSITGLAKLASISGSAAILDMADPIVGVSFRHLMLLASMLELMIAAVCFFTVIGGKNWELLSAALTLWFALMVAGYRLCLLMIGYVRPCKCMGNLMDAIHVPPMMVNSIMKFVLGYLLIGGSLTLIFLWTANSREDK